jgi:hypothetical protein
VFVCGSCSTAEVVKWCGQNLDCRHPECAAALARCAARTGSTAVTSTGR